MFEFAKALVDFGEQGCGFKDPTCEEYITTGFLCQHLLFDKKKVWVYTPFNNIIVFFFCTV